MNEFTIHTGISDIFAIAEDSGGEDQQRGSLVRCLLAYEIVGIALGSSDVLEVVCSTPTMLRDLVPKYEKVHHRVISGAIFLYFFFFLSKTIVFSFFLSVES